MVSAARYPAMNGRDFRANRPKPGFRPSAPAPRPPISFKPRLKMF